MLRRYAFGAGVDRPLVWYEGSGLTTRKWLHADELGSVIATSDNSGVGTLYNYGPYGEPDTTNGWSGSRFRYTGQIALFEAHLYHYKARVYDPLLGRFLQTDPVGYKDDLDLYAYVRNDPLNGADPTGLAQMRSPNRDSSACESATSDRSKEGWQCVYDAGGREHSARPGVDVVRGPRFTQVSYRTSCSIVVGSCMRRLTEHERAAGLWSHPTMDLSSVRLFFDSLSPTAAITLGSSIHFPAFAAECADFTECGDDGYTFWLVHELTHVWQGQRGIDTFFGRAWDMLRFGDYLDQSEYLRAASPAGLNTEEEADWYAWQYICTFRTECTH